MTDVREFLDSLRTNKAEIALCRARIAQLETAATRITTVWKEVPGGGNGDPHKDATLAALADARSRLIDEETQLAKNILSVSDFIDRIPGITYRTILNLRYVECLSWEGVTEKMEEMGIPYACRHVIRLHGKALNAARKLWAQEKGAEE